MKNNKLVLLGCFLFIFSLILINPRSGNRESYDPLIKNNEDLERIYEPLSSDGTTTYSHNYFYIIDETFDDRNDWTESGDGEALIDSNQLRMEGIDDPGNFLEEDDENVYMEYNNPIPQFINGDLQFYYEITSGGVGHNHQLRFQVSTDGGSSWANLLEQSSGSGTVYFDLETEGYSDESNLAFRFHFTATDDTDYALVDNFQLGNYEFCWTENVDNIDPDVNQGINSYLNPQSTNYIDDLDTDNVSLWYNINDNQVQNGDEIISNERSNNFTFSIPASAYSSSDKVYYQIWINHETTQEIHKSSVESFTCIDRAAPTISNIKTNETDYENDILLSCYVEDNQNGVGLKNVTLYINNETETDEDILVLSNSSSSIPENGGNFGFVISSHYLSADKDLTYEINYEDLNGNSDISSGSLNIGDIKAPSALYNDDNSDGGTIDSFENFLVNYSVTEPLPASGLKDVELLIKIGDQAPTSNADFDIKLIPKEAVTLRGGIFNFNLSYSEYDYNKTIYHFINATDQYSNNYIDYTQASSHIIQITDNSVPQVRINDSNLEPCGYNHNKILKFELFEPKGGAGIKNDSITLYYQLNEELTDPQSLSTNISKYGGVISFQLNYTDFNWKYGDKLYFQLNVSDRDDNEYFTGILNFTITDLVSPNYNENLTLNTNGWIYENYKLMNFSVEDPDYDGGLELSSGIDNVKLYYKPGEEPTKNDFTGELIQSMISPSNKTYTFNLTLTQSMYQTDPTIFYMLNVTDVAGNSRVSSTQTFQLFPHPYIITSDDHLDEVIGSTEFTIDFKLNFKCDIIYTIFQDEDFYNSQLVRFTDHFHQKFNLPENTYEIVFNFTGTGQTYTFSTELDVTPVQPIDSLEAKVYGSEVVELTWQAPPNADPQTIYKIYRSSEADFKALDGDLIGTISPGEDLSFEDNSVEGGKTYYYKIISIDRVGNIQTESIEVTAKVRQSPLPIIISLIVIGAIVGVGGFVTYKKVTAKKRDKLFSEVDLSKLDLDEDFEEEKR